MNIAVFYPQTLYWSGCQGLARAYKRMGHDVYFHGAHVPFEKLSKVDVIILAGADKLIDLITGIHGREKWKGLQVPKAAWYHRALNRDEDPLNFDDVGWLADEHFFPAQQEAEFYDQEGLAQGHSHWLPFGVDEEMFYPENAGDPPMSVAFTGTMHRKRERYMKVLAEHSIPEIRCGQAVSVRTDGVDLFASAEALRRDYSRTRIVFNLPGRSRAVSPRVYEALACGAFVMTPAFDLDAATQMSQFEDGVDLSYYKSAHFGGVAQMLRDYIRNPAECAKISATGQAKVLQQHTISHRAQEILGSMKIGTGSATTAA